MKVTVELKLWAVSLFFENNDGGEDSPAVQHTLDIMGAGDKESALGAAIIKAGEDGVGGLKNGFVLVGYQITEISQAIMQKHNSDILLVEPTTQRPGKVVN